MPIKQEQIGDGEDDMHPEVEIFKVRGRVIKFNHY
jgi:hypothetical protein